MSRDNLRSLQVDTVASGTLPTLEALGITPATIAQAWAEEGGDAALMRELLHWRAVRRDG
jgi:hypothetical protein